MLIHDKIGQEIRARAAGLEKKYGVSLVPQVMALVNSAKLSPDSFERLVEAVQPHASRTGIERDSRTDGIRNKIPELQVAEGNLEEFSRSHDWAELIRQRDLVTENMELMRAKVQSVLNSSGLSGGTMINKWVDRATRTIGYANQVVSLVKGLHGIPL